MEKQWNFLKVHFISHALDDICYAGSSINATTRVGEGTHQELAAFYSRSNRRNADFQVAFLFLCNTN
jgi:hypothetical protein